MYIVLKCVTRQCAARRVEITGSLSVEVTGRLVTRLYIGFTWTSALTADQLLAAISSGVRTHPGSISAEG